MKTVLCYFVMLGWLCTHATSLAQASPVKRISDKEAQKLAIRSPRPDYPLEARQKKMTGCGVVLVSVGSDGIVTSSTMATSTGTPILDRAATSGFKRWRFRGGQAFVFRSPICFTMAGSQY